MRLFTPMLVAALAATSFAAVPADAHKRNYRHSHGATAQERYEDCRADKRRSGHQGIAIGAVAGGAGTALLGGNVGESLLGAAAGGAAGNFIGRGTPHRCSRGR